MDYSLSLHRAQRPHLLLLRPCPRHYPAETGPLLQTGKAAYVTARAQRVWFVHDAGADLVYKLFFDGE